MTVTDQEKTPLKSRKNPLSEATNPNATGRAQESTRIERECSKTRDAYIGDWTRTSEKHEVDPGVSADRRDNRFVRGRAKRLPARIVTVRSR
jgi:hypothetical protein